MIVCLAALTLLAGPPSFPAQTLGDPTLGAPLTIEYRLPAPLADVVLAPARDGKGYRVLDLERIAAPDDSSTTIVRMTIQPLNVGDLKVAAPEAQIRDAGGIGRDVELEPLTLKVPDPLAGTPEPRLEPSRPVRKIPFRWWPYALAIAVGVAAAVWWRMSRNKPAAAAPAPAPAPPPLSPWAKALARLEELQPTGEEEPEAARAHVDAISDVLRVYIEDRFGIQAPERTTEEFLSEAYRVHELTQNRDMLKTFLERCDRVKFAGETPTRAGIESVLTDAREFVRKTTPRIERAA